MGRLVISYKFEFEGKEKIKKMTMKENINEEERKKNEEKMITFRNIILGEDYLEKYLRDIERLRISLKRICKLLMCWMIRRSSLI